MGLNLGNTNEMKRGKWNYCIFSCENWLRVEMIEEVKGGYACLWMNTYMKW